MKKIITTIVIAVATVFAFAKTADEKAIEANIQAQSITISQDMVVPNNYGELFLTEEMGDFNVFLLKKIKELLCEKEPSCRVMTTAEVGTINVKGTSATAEVFLKTRCTPKRVEFQDNDVRCIMTFKKVNGQWKMAENKVKDVKYL